LGLMAVLACRLTILRLKKAQSQGIASCLHMSKGRKHRIKSTNSYCLQLTLTKSLHSRYPTAKWTDPTACSLTGNLLLTHLSVCSSLSVLFDLLFPYNRMPALQQLQPFCTHLQWHWTCCFSYKTMPALQQLQSFAYVYIGNRHLVVIQPEHSESRVTTLLHWTIMGRTYTKLLPNVCLYSSTHRLAGNM